MKNFLIALLLLVTTVASAQVCNQPACENLPATITANVTAPPAGTTYSYFWTVATLTFTGQGAAQIAIANVGAAPASYAYTVEVTNDQTGCVTVHNCNLTVTLSSPLVFNIPPYCAGSVPFDISTYIPAGATATGAALTGTMYDPAIGGSVTATPAAGAGCLTATTVTPTVNVGPVIISTTVTQ